jgi:hypothetical protein
MSQKASMNLCNSKATAGPSQVGKGCSDCRCDIFGIEVVVNSYIDAESCPDD